MPVIMFFKCFVKKSSSFKLTLAIACGFSLLYFLFFVLFHNMKRHLLLQSSNKNFTQNRNAISHSLVSAIQKIYSGKFFFLSESKKHHAIKSVNESWKTRIDHIDLYSNLKRRLEKYNLNLTSLTQQLDEQLKKASKKKIPIVMWDPPWGIRKFGQFQMINSSECGYCEVTFDRTLVEDPDTKAVVFHFFEYRISNMPSVRRADQYFVYWLMESPTWTIEENIPLEKYDNIFNLTMSHRSDSDVVSPYGFPIHTINLIQRGKHDSVDALVKRKKKLALWMVSNCLKSRGARLRMKLVHSLVDAGLNVDVGGKCFPNGVKDWSNTDYKFYLAFENSYHCRGYITEKLYRNSFKFGMVPVVFGAFKEDYLIASPPNSFIYAEDFSLRQLVSFLNYLDKNDTAYRKYLEWRDIDITKLLDYRRAWSYCHLCRFLHGINYDNIFSQNFETHLRNFSLFGDGGKRNVKSISSWFYGREHKHCLLV